MNVEKNEQAKYLPKVFTFNPSNQPIRVEVINNEPYFVAKDVCDALSISNNRDAMTRLEDDEKLTSVVPTSGQNREMWFVNESGLYNLIFQSRKPEAKSFRKWVTGEVLPAIRKTGRYEVAAHQFNPSEVVDLRTTPYQYRSINNYQVRCINHNDVDFYSINDVMMSIGARTNSYQVVRKLNVKYTIAIKVHLFGNTHPSWMCTMTGVNLIMSGSRKIKNDNQSAQLMIGGKE
jgi:Prophage antirepressor